MWIRLALPGAATELVLVTWFPQMKPGSVQGVVLTTKNLADMHAKLTARKLDISDIKKQPWGLEATFRDPDGDGWCCSNQSEPDPPQWNTKVEPGRERAPTRHGESGQHG